MNREQLNSFRTAIRRSLLKEDEQGGNTNPSGTPGLPIYGVTKDRIYNSPYYGPFGQNPYGIPTNPVPYPEYVSPFSNPNWPFNNPSLPGYIPPRSPNQLGYRSAYAPPGPGIGPDGTPLPPPPQPTQPPVFIPNPPSPRPRPGPYGYYGY